MRRFFEKNVAQRPGWWTTSGHRQGACAVATRPEVAFHLARQFSTAGGYTLDAAGLKELNSSLILKEYLDEFHGQIPA